MALLDRVHADEVVSRDGSRRLDQFVTTAATATLADTTVATGTSVGLLTATTRSDRSGPDT